MQETETLTAVGNNVIIRPTKPDEVTKGGIVLPQGAQEKTARGTVVSVSYGAEEEQVLKEGDMVLHAKHAGNIIELNGETLLVVRKPDVMCVIKEEDAE